MATNKYRQTERNTEPPFGHDHRSGGWVQEGAVGGWQVAPGEERASDIISEYLFTRKESIIKEKMVDLMWRKLAKTK